MLYCRITATCTGQHGSYRWLLDYLGQHDQLGLACGPAALQRAPVRLLGGHRARQVGRRRLQRACV